MESGWIGFDLDGTLAVYDEWRGVEHIGEPIKKMVELVKAYIADGHTVKIFTARVCEREDGEQERAREVITEWCKEHIGQVLEVTNIKDYGMIMLYDDRAVQVLPNRGLLVQDLVA